MREGHDPYTAALCEAVAAAKSGDPLSPVTVLTSSGFSATFTRRVLAGIDCGSRRGVANVEVLPFHKFVGLLGSSLLARRGLRVASRAQEIEAIRLSVAQSDGGLRWSARDRRALSALKVTLDELGRFPPDLLQSLARRGDRAGELARLHASVRDRLGASGLADEALLAQCAIEAAASRSAATDAVGGLVVADVGDLATLEAELLRRLGVLLGGPVVIEPRSSRLTHMKSYADSDHEVRGTVHRVIANAEAGIALWRQAILHPPGGPYGRLVRHHLSRAGVPASFAESLKLDRSMVGKALRGALDLGSANWQRDQVMAWVSCAPVLQGPEGPPVPSTRWDALSARAGIIEGIDQWRGQLRHIAQRHEAEGEDAARLLNFVEDLARFALPPRGTWSEMARRTATLLEHFVDIDGAWTEIPPSEARAAKQVRGLLRDIESLDAISEASGETCDLDNFRETVASLLGETAMELDEDEGGIGDGVFVGPLAQARGLRFDLVALIGLADSLYPGAGGKDGLLPDDLRHDIGRETGTELLATRATRTEGLRHDLEAACRAGRFERIASFPRFDMRSGSAHFPSSFIVALAEPAMRREDIASFAQTVLGESIALGSDELALRQMKDWVRSGKDVADAPPVVADVRLKAGIDAVRCRASERFTRFDGALGAGAVSPFDPRAAVSATRLETYASCPRRFLFGKVLGLEKRKLPEALWRIEPMDRGTLVHGILEDYVRARIEGAAATLDELLEIAEHHFADAESAGHVGKALLWELDKAAMRRELAVFVEEEGDLVPLAAELAFGTEEDDGDPPVEVELGGGRKVSFRGRADRVDKSPDGHLVVSDYKTGRQYGLSNLTGDPFDRGRRLQLPLYGLAAKRRFGTSGPVHARYWLLSEERIAPCYHLQLTDEVEVGFKEVIGHIVEGIDNGAFPAIPGPPRFASFENCSYCDFDRICPTSRDRQWSSKRSAPELASVVALAEEEVPQSLFGAVTTGFVDFRGAR